VRNPWHVPTDVWSKVLIDPWSYLNFKPATEAGSTTGQGIFWIREEDARGLAAYKLYSAYDHNQAGHLTDPSAEPRRSAGSSATRSCLSTRSSPTCSRPTQEIVVSGTETEGSPEAKTQKALREWTERELHPGRRTQSGLNRSGFDRDSHS